jgi:hypothetical protein
MGLGEALCRDVLGICVCVYFFDKYTDIKPIILKKRRPALIEHYCPLP